MTVTLVIGCNLEKEKASKEYQIAQAKIMPNAKLREISGLGGFAGCAAQRDSSAWRVRWSGTPRRKPR